MSLLNTARTGSAEPSGDCSPRSVAAVTSLNVIN